MKHRIPGGLASLGMAMLFAAFSLWWTHPWIYSRGFGEVDSMDIAAGIRQGQLGGLGLREPLLYLPQAQQLYYALFFHWPWSNTWSIEAITYWMNRLSWAASGLSVGLLFLLLRRLALSEVGGEDLGQPVGVLGQSGRGEELHLLVDAVDQHDDVRLRLALDFKRVEPRKP